MPSPFPGMNPYLELDEIWDGFGMGFMTYAQGLLTRQVDSRYLVRQDVRPRPVKISSPRKHVALEIQEAETREVVTRLELLGSPRKDERDEYFAMRSVMLNGGFHLVEIDLRRGGKRPFPQKLPKGDYCAIVSRSSDRTRLEIYPIALRDRLPIIRLPLASPDKDLPFDLKAVLDQAFDVADYGKYIYEETPEPPLSAEDEAWARKLIPG